MVSEKTDRAAGPMIWQNMSGPAIGTARDEGAVVLLTLGAIEQHGPHLSVGTDTVLPYEALLEAARRRSYMIVAPPIWWGLSGQHKRFPGVLTLRSSTYYALLWDLCDSLIDQGFRKIVLVVGHLGNMPMAQMLVSEYMQQRNVPLLEFAYVALGAGTFQSIRKSGVGGEFHAGELETALALHLTPQHVGLDDAPTHYVDPKTDFGSSAATTDAFGQGQAAIGYDLKKSFPEGVAGDPTVATAETGRQTFEAIVDRLCEIVDEYRNL
jgi:creatinine amidohydrolase